MSTFLRSMALVSSLALVLFYCSCERHKADELAHGHGPGHGDPHAADHAHGDSGKQDAHAQAHETDQTRATTAMSVSPAPKQSPTPANFFPTATPH